MPSHPGLPHFCFSSRRRHTRCGRDWSSDVCSSDLREHGPQQGIPREVIEVAPLDEPPPPQEDQPSLAVPFPDVPAKKMPRSSERSEEHTSELQSRPHLVCRLLLEKKKKNRKFSCSGTDTV